MIGLVGVNAIAHMVMDVLEPFVPLVGLREIRADGTTGCAVKRVVIALTEEELGRLLNDERCGPLVELSLERAAVLEAAARKGAKHGEC